VNNKKLTPRKNNKGSSNKENPVSIRGNSINFPDNSVFSDAKLSILPTFCKISVWMFEKSSNFLKISSSLAAFAISFALIVFITFKVQMTTEKHVIKLKIDNIVVGLISLRFLCNFIEYNFIFKNFIFLNAKFSKYEK